MHPVTRQSLEQAILELLTRRAQGNTIRPSEAARAVGSEDGAGLMDSVRETAQRLEAAGRVVIYQGGRPVAPDQPRGPIRIGPAPCSSDAPPDGSSS